MASLDESLEALRGLPGAEAARGPHEEGGSHLATKGAIFSRLGRAGLWAWGVGGWELCSVGFPRRKKWGCGRPAFPKGHLLGKWPVLVPHPVFLALRQEGVLISLGKCVFLV